MFKTTRSITSSLSLALILSLALLGCEENKSTPIGVPNPSTNNKNNGDPPKKDMGPDTDNNNDENGHGGDGGTPIGVHSMHGVWNVVTDDADETPVLTASISIEENASTGEGDFTTGPFFGSEAAGEYGDFSSIEVTDSSMVITFNHSNDEEQLYTVNASEKVDKDTFKGTLTDKTSINQKIVVKRKIFPK